MNFSAQFAAAELTGAEATPEAEGAVPPPQAVKAAAINRAARANASFFIYDSPLLLNLSAKAPAQAF